MTGRFNAAGNRADNPGVPLKIEKTKEPRVDARPLKPWLAYLLAIVATMATLGVRLALDGKLGGQSALVVFAVPIMLSAYVGGLRAGLLATGLSCVLVSYFVLPPISGFQLDSTVFTWQLFFVLLAGIVISFLNEALHAARRRADIAIRQYQQAEAAIRDSEQKLRKVIDGLGPNTFLGLMSPDGILIEANRPGLVAAELRAEDVLGKPFDQTYWWSYSEAVREKLRAAMVRAAAGEASRYDVQVRVAGQNLAWIDFSLNPVLDANGDVIYIVPSGVIIEERVRAEEQILQAGALQNAIFNSANFSSIATDAKGV
ncbi:MAG: DUF4118 domain-containing protein, partial [Gemmatimonadaceae bacterium]